MGKKTTDEDPEELDPTIRYEIPIRNQAIAAIICHLGMFCSGLGVGWMSPVIEKLEKAGWVSKQDSVLSGAMIPIGAFVSLLTFGPIAAKFGRKFGGFYSGFVYLTGFSLKGVAIFIKNPMILLAGRFFCGVGTGSVTSLSTLYVGETAHESCRGLLGSLMLVEYGLGILFIYTIGAFIEDPQILTTIIIPIPILFITSFSFLPETPTQLLRQNKIKAAAKSIAWLKKLPLHSDQLFEELDEYVRQLKMVIILPRPERYIFDEEQGTYKLLRTRNINNITLKSEDTSKSASLQQTFKLLISSKATMNGLHLCLALVTAQTFTGLFAIATYTSYIFAQAGSPLSPDTASILYGIFFIAGTIAASLFMENFGRRKLQITSCTTIAVCYISLAISLQMVESGAEGIIRYVPLITLPMSVFAYNLGAAVIPFIIVSEVFDLEIKDLATALIMVYVWVSVFILLYTFPYMVEGLGLTNTFYVFASVAVFSVIHSYFFLFETKGKSLNEIKLELSGEKNKKEIKDENSPRPSNP